METKFSDTEVTLFLKVCIQNRAVLTWKEKKARLRRYFTKCSILIVLNSSLLKFSKVFKMRADLLLRGINFGLNENCPDDTGVRDCENDCYNDLTQENR